MLNKSSVTSAVQAHINEFNSNSDNNFNDLFDDAVKDPSGKKMKEVLDKQPKEAANYVFHKGHEDHGSTLLQVATKNRLVKIVEVLLLAGADPNIGNERPLYTAVKQGDIPTTEMLLVHNAEYGQAFDSLRTEEWTYPNYPYYSWQSTLRKAAYEGNVEMVKLLLPKAVAEENSLHSNMKPDISAALWVAVYHGHVEVVRLLLESSDSRQLIHDYHALEVAVQCTEKNKNEVKISKDAEQGFLQDEKQGILTHDEVACAAQIKLELSHQTEKKEARLKSQTETMKLLFNFFQEVQPADMNQEISTFVESTFKSVFDSNDIFIQEPYLKVLERHKGKIEEIQLYHAVKHGKDKMVSMILDSADSPKSIGGEWFAHMFDYSVTDKQRAATLTSLLERNIYPTVETANGGSTQMVLETFGIKPDPDKIFEQVAQLSESLQEKMRRTAQQLPPR